MLYPILVALLLVSLPASGQPNCTGIRLDVDARCGCVKDPNSELCKMVKAGFYDTDRSKTMKPFSLGWTGTGIQPAAGASRSRAQVSQPARQARVVPLAHKDYLRFLHPNAQMVAGGDIGKLFQTAELLGGLLGQGEGALREIDRIWLSIAPGNDVVLLMTGRFEQGAAAGMFYSQGIVPVFLGGAHAMMIGSEPSLQAALARLRNPVAPAGWAARRARELSRDHETWIVNDRSAAGQGSGALRTVRQFALGFRLTGEQGADGEAVADSEASAVEIAAWLDQTKASLRQMTGTGVLDSLNVERSGATLRFSATDRALLSGTAGRAALQSDFGVELYALMFGGFPGIQARSVAENKLLALKAGSTREDVLAMLGPPLSVSAIQGLEPPRETWTYQVPFGKKYSLRLEGGVVSGPLAQTR